ncbi:hypothetical protein BKA61DRAFT_661807 [Leptodontidium sp. MPI-SDFR-AT-0119]|nr:hypothetical protein BKA61DRAFT_661807 [Leptodontidium sp. MPI-SDFR-AT-0119]
MRLLDFLLLLSCVPFTGAIINTTHPCGDDTYGADLLNLTISTQDDVKSASGCSTIYANIIVEKTFPGLVSLPALGLLIGSIFVGDIRDSPKVDPSTLTGLSFGNLSAVGGNISISGAGGITSLKFPILGRIGGPTLDGDYYPILSAEGIIFSDLPGLKDLDPFPKLANLSKITIANTGIDTLEWGKTFPLISGNPWNEQELEYSYPLTKVEISSNVNLQEINLASLKRSATLTILGNGNSSLFVGIERMEGMLEVAGIASWLPGFGSDGFGFPHLKVSGNVYDSVSVNFHDNGVANLALDAVHVAGSIRISNNPYLESFTFSALTGVTDVTVTNNSVLKVIDDESLGTGTSAYGHLVLTGAFTNWITSGAAKSVTIFTTANASCSIWDDQYHQYKHIIDFYNCTSVGAHQSTTWTRTDAPVKTTPGHIDSALLAQILVPIIFTITSIATWWWWCVRHRRRKRERKAMAAQLATIAAVFTAHEPQKQENSKPTVAITTARDISAFEKPELDSAGMVAANRDLEANGHQRGSSQHELGSERLSPQRVLSDTVLTLPAEMDSRHAQPNELDGGSRLSRVEQLEARERALAAREDAAIRAREEALLAREREVEQLERQNTAISLLTAAASQEGNTDKTLR